MFDLQHFETEGFAITSPLFSSTETQQIISLLEQQRPPDEGPRRGGIRDVLDTLPAMRDLADHHPVRSIVDQILGPEAFVVRSTLFDKTETSNWKVPWHQDVTIAVQERRDTKGYGPWSTKSGVVHVQPPTSVLARMATIRIHLDPCPATNGALRVMPGTHQLGRLNQNHVEAHIDETRTVTCEAQAGEALIMRPLLLHASSPSVVPGHRRVLHFDFATGELANGLIWRMR
jgi:ectoine hydroxylase-related dioxygenase (phytanoyl-CoA dioxygenase family)